MTLNDILDIHSPHEEDMTPLCPIKIKKGGRDISYNPKNIKSIPKTDLQTFVELTSNFLYDIGYRNFESGEVPSRSEHLFDYKIGRKRNPVELQFSGGNMRFIGYNSGRLVLKISEGINGSQTFECEEKLGKKNFGNRFRVLNTVSSLLEQYRNSSGKNPTHKMEIYKGNNKNGKRKLISEEGQYTGNYDQKHISNL
jgi:hypothetical protein